MALLAVAAILALTILNARREREYSRRELSRMAEIVVETTALSMRDELYSLKLDELQDLADKFDTNDEITLFVIYDKAGKILVDSRSDELEFSQAPDSLGIVLIGLKPNVTHYEWRTSQLIAGQAVRIGNHVIGAIAIGFSTAQVEEKASQMERQGIIFAFIFIMVSAALNFVIARRITTPLSHLAKAADEMARGDAGVRAVPYHVDNEVGTLSAAFNRMAEAIQERERALRQQADNLEKIVHERTLDLQEQARTLEQMAITDPLTLAYNRRQFYKLAEVEMRQSQENNQPLSVIVMDADHFKRINDKYGHQAGDKALVQLTSICQSVIRETDLFARYGGEEFVLLMPNTSVRLGKQIAERLRQKVEESQIAVSEGVLRFTISIGVSTYHGSQDITFDSLLAQADRSLYISKQEGRNRVTHWLDAVALFN